MQPSALRSGKYDTSNSKLNGLKFDLSEIHDIYGYDASLYHVLSIKRNATASEIKASYLNKGRELLLSGEHPSQPGSVSEGSRKQFQAISLAYEILSKEDLRALYDGRCTVARRNSVQWSKVVEEKVIKDAHPDEHSHRRYSKRAPPVYDDDDACTGLDDEFDELMYYCNNSGGVSVIELAKLQWLVHTLNTSMKTKRMQLLESFDTKSDSERQPSEEVAISEVGDQQRHPPTELEDTGVIQAHNEDTCNFVCDAAEDTIFPVKGDASQEVDEEELVSSTEAFAVAATAAAVVFVNAKEEKEEKEEEEACGALESVNGDVNDMSECSAIKTKKSKTRPSLSLRKAKVAMTSRMKSKSKLDAKEGEKSSEVTAAEVASAAAVTSAGWFACCGATEAFANNNNDDDDAEKVDRDNKAGNEKKTPAEEATTEADVSVADATVEASITGAEEKTAYSKTRPAMNLHKAKAAVSSRMKSKSKLDAKEGEKSSEVAAAAAVTSAGWFACCGATEAFANDHEEMTVSKAMAAEEATKAALLEENCVGVAEEDYCGEAESKTVNQTNPSRKLHMPISIRTKLHNTEKKPSDETTKEQHDHLEEEDLAGSSFFCCFGASEIIPEGAEEADTTKSEAKSHSRMNKSAKKLRNQLAIRKISTKPLLDTAEDETLDVDSEVITANAERTTQAILGNLWLDFVETTVMSSPFCKATCGDFDDEITAEEKPRRNLKMSLKKKKSFKRS